MSVSVRHVREHSEPTNKTIVISCLQLPSDPALKSIAMAPRPKSYPTRLGPPPQLNSLKHIPVVQQKFANKVQPKLREVLMTHVKILSKWFHNNLSWKKILLFWMVLLIASKMILLMLTNQFFTMMSLVSLEVGGIKMSEYLSKSKSECQNIVSVSILVLLSLTLNLNISLEAARRVFRN